MLNRKEEIGMRSCKTRIRESKNSESVKSETIVGKLNIYVSPLSGETYWFGWRLEDLRL